MRVNLGAGRKWGRIPCSDSHVLCVIVQNLVKLPASSWWPWYIRNKSVPAEKPVSKEWKPIKTGQIQMKTLTAHCWGSDTVFVCMFIFILKWEYAAGCLQVYSAFRWVCRWVCPSHPSFMDRVCGMAGLCSMWCLGMQELLWQEHCFISLLHVCVSIYIYTHLYASISMHRGTCLCLFKIYIYIQRSVSAGFTLGF